MNTRPSNHRLGFGTVIKRGKFRPLSFGRIVPDLLVLVLAGCGCPAGAWAAQGLSGTLVSWGGTVIPYVSPGTRFKAIAGGEYHSLALAEDGTITAWGDNTQGQSRAPAGLSNVNAIAARGSGSLALKQDGTVVAWGLDNVGQTNVPSGLAGVVAIAAGAAHSLALKQDGAVVTWGDDGWVRPRDCSTAPAAR
jgi:alpha-tubulin suppressor-like RCC1 family protein